MKEGRERVACSLFLNVPVGHTLGRALARTDFKFFFPTANALNLLKVGALCLGTGQGLNGLPPRAINKATHCTPQVRQQVGSDMDATRCIYIHTPG